MSTIRNHAIPFLLPIDSPQADLAQVGGKGANLARLARAGFPVPAGFLLTTHAYTWFLTAAHLQAWIQAQVQATDLTSPDALADLSDRIRARFRTATVPEAIAQLTLRQYAALKRPPVAVRSSATAEDLPDMSFAGQQDTFLNIVGDEALMEAVVECWSSLWTARAIGYRHRNQIDHTDVALAVIVQEMVQSHVSGVLFTANPLNGRRTETVIDATWGLGEALVSGLVEPDHYVVETASGRVLAKTVGAKATVIRSAAGGGTTTEQRDGLQEQTLREETIQALTGLGRKVADLYATPQDLEWAIADDELFLLQSRPITSLYPLPDRGDEDDLHLFFSFGAVQGILDPITPLGQDTLKTAAAGGAGLYGYDRTARTQGVGFTAGERLWINLTPVVRNGLGRSLLKGAIRAIEPGAADAFIALLDDPRLAPTAQRPSKDLLLRARPMVQVALRLLVSSLLRPDAARQSMQQEIESAVEQVTAWAASAHSLAERIAVHERIARSTFPLLLPRFLPRVMAGYLCFNLLLRIARRLAESVPEVDDQTVYSLTRGLPHNVTTEMDLGLWRTAQAIRQDPGAVRAFREEQPEDLAQAFTAKSLPPAAQEAMERFLQRYGMRGLGEIDFGRPRWRERPVPVFETIQSYLGIEDPEAAPDAVFRRGEAAAEAAVESLIAAADQADRSTGRADRSTGRADLDAISGGLVRWLIRRVRALAGLRESPKFTIIRLFGISRAAMLASGQELVAQGVLARADDLFFLHLDELKVLAMGAPGDWQGLVQRRRQRYAQEKRRQQIPRLLLSDGTTIYDGLGADLTESDDTLVGSPVSAGIAEGSVRIVSDPYGANLQPGEILVCHGTDPAWTPLFLAAAGLVMEVGGLMTHGSVVAREYGIPAVVGVDRATQRLQTGERIRIDGSQGTISRIQ